MKKIFAILIVLATLGLVMGGVSAAVELVDHDFDGHFKLKVPKNATFKKTDSSGGLLDDAVSYSDSANDMNITYLMSSDVDDSLVNKTLKDLKAKGANVTKTGDMYKIGANELNGALRIKDVEMVMVLSTHYDMDTLVSMVESLS